MSIFLNTKMGSLIVFIFTKNLNQSFKLSSFIWLVSADKAKPKLKEVATKFAHEPISHKGEILQHNLNGLHK